MANRPFTCHITVDRTEYSQQGWRLTQIRNNVLDALLWEFRPIYNRRFRGDFSVTADTVPSQVPALVVEVNLPFDHEVATQKDEFEARLREHLRSALPYTKGKTMIRLKVAEETRRAAVRSH
ncbi:MAG TPA: hypothetical protein VHD84_00745 [Candidatus Saccharimonadales bacterium]|nr:hypothetical protein [Candidatus Saccharimonadales bacterium]